MKEKEKGKTDRDKGVWGSPVRGPGTATDFVRLESLFTFLMFFFFFFRDTYKQCILFIIPKFNFMAGQHRDEIT